MIKALWVAQPGQLGQGWTIDNQSMRERCCQLLAQAKVSVFSYKRSLNIASVDSARRVILFPRNCTLYKRGSS